MKQFHFLINLTILTITFCHISYGQTKSKTKSIENSQILLNKLIGTWKLIEFADLDSTTDKWEYAYGKHPKGFFTYTKTGIVNLNIPVDTALTISEDSAKNYNVNLLKWVYNYSFGYFGTYSVDFNKSIITHHVTGGSLPWFVETDQPRPFSFKGDTLVIGDNKTWRRVLIKAD